MLSGAAPAWVIEPSQELQQLQMSSARYGSMEPREGECSRDHASGLCDCRMSETEPGVRIKYVRRPRERMAPTAAGRLAGAVRSALHRCYTNESSQA